MDLTLMPAALAGVAASLIAAGLAMGFLAGLFGVGGGAIIVPALYELFSTLGVAEAHRLHLAIGTSLAVMIPTSARSFLGHKAKGVVDIGFLRRTGPYVVGGIVIGTFVARYAPGIALKWLWGIVSTLIAAKMLLARDGWRLGDDVPKGWGTEIYAAATGCISMLMSIGGGVFMTTFLTLYNRPILPAIATSSGFGPLIAIPGALGFVWAGWGVTGLPPFTLGYISLLGAAIVIPASVLAAPWGVKLAHGIPRRRLEIAFAVFMLCVAVRFVMAALR